MVKFAWACAKVKPGSGLRDSRWLYVRDEQGPWLLFDRQADPFQGPRQ